MLRPMITSSQASPATTWKRWKCWANGSIIWETSEMMTNTFSETKLSFVQFWSCAGWRIRNYYFNIKNVLRKSPYRCIDIYLDMLGTYAIGCAIWWIGSKKLERKKQERRISGEEANIRQPEATWCMNSSMSWPVMVQSCSCSRGWTPHLWDRNK